jgi:hypothetical protein
MPLREREETIGVLHCDATHVADQLGLTARLLDLTQPCVQRFVRSPEPPVTIQMSLHRLCPPRVNRLESSAHQVS